MRANGTSVRRHSGRLALFVAAFPALIALGTVSGTAQAGVVVQSDLELTHTNAAVVSAAVGDRVVFRARGTNLGPVTSQLDVTYSDARHIAVKREVCLVPPLESGEVNAPSPDTPSCEFSAVPAGDYVVVKIVAVVTGVAGQRAGLTFCTSNETGFADPDPSNDCKSANIVIAAY